MELEDITGLLTILVILQYLQVSQPMHGVT
jgi:hypothetical protein